MFGKTAAAEAVCLLRLTLGGTTSNLGCILATVVEQRPRPRQATTITSYYRLLR